MQRKIRLCSQSNSCKGLSVLLLPLSVCVSLVLSQHPARLLKRPRSLVCKNTSCFANENTALHYTL